MIDYAIQLSGSGRLPIHHQVTGGHSERVGDIEEPLVEQTALPTLHRAQNGTSDAGLMGQLLLRHASLDAELAYSLADGLSSALPCSHTLRTVLAWSGGHAHT